MLDLPVCVAQLMVEAEDTSLTLSWIDAISILFFGYGFISAHRLGLFGELPRALAWLAALGVGLRGFSYVGKQLHENANAGPETAPFYAFVLISIFFLSIGYVIGMTLSRLRKKTVSGGLDLWGGFLLGPIKAVAAYLWIMIALLLMPSVWTRNHLGYETLTGNVILKYFPEVRSQVQSSRGKKDSMDEFIERKKRKAPEAEVDVMEPPLDADGNPPESGNQ
jgi:uncharacterized membrane protein required for colicin V production